MINVGILAYNEEQNIRACVRSVLDGFDGDDGKVWVIVNGSSDSTEHIVRTMAAEDARVVLRVVHVGDKSNAWNEFVLDAADPDADYYVLIDGDVRVRPGSLQAITAAFAANPEAIAASTMPHGGRTAGEWAGRVLREHGLPGNFYALRGSLVRRMRDSGFRLPFGMIGDDTFLLWLLRHNMDPKAPARKEWIQPVADAGFDYDSFEMSASGVWAHVRRLSKYAVRDVEVKLLIDRLTAGGMAAMPGNIREVYRDAKVMSQFMAPYGRRTKYNHRKLFFLLTWIRMKRRAAG